MRARRETLSAATADLERALHSPTAQDPKGWAARLEQSLSAVTTAASRHYTSLQAIGGGLVDVGSARSPSPGLDRRMNRLHDNLGSFLDAANFLLADVGEACLAPAAHDLDDLRARCAELLKAVQRYEREEVQVILETVTTDIGAGD